jgi:hypothetical protein
MAKSLYLALKFGRISGWVYWAMADYVIKNNKLTPLGRAFQQYYRFLLPGTVMIKAEAADNGLLVVAGKKDENLVIIVINNSDQDKTIQLEGPGIPAEYFAYRTSSAENFSHLSNTGLTSIPVKANSITTLSNVGLPTGQQQAQSREDIMMFPNPAMNNVVVKNARGCDFTLRDYQGRCLLTKRLTDNEQLINLDDLHAGMYIVTISDNNRIRAEKLSIITKI